MEGIDDLPPPATIPAEPETLRLRPCRVLLNPEEVSGYFNSKRGCYLYSPQRAAQLQQLRAGKSGPSLNTSERSKRVKHPTMKLLLFKASYDTILPTHRTYKCPVCKKLFPDSNRLKRHIVIHNEESPHVCHVCHRSFKHSKYLTKHMTMHQEVKKRMCQICSKVFIIHDDFIAHVSSESCFAQKDEKTSVTDNLESVFIVNNKKKNKSSNENLIRDSSDVLKKVCHDNNGISNERTELIFDTENANKDTSNKLEKVLLDNNLNLSVNNKIKQNSVYKISLLKNQHPKKVNKNLTNSHPKVKMQRCPKCRRCFLDYGKLKAHVIEGICHKTPIVNIPKEICTVKQAVNIPREICNKNTVVNIVKKTCIENQDVNTATEGCNVIEAVNICSDNSISSQQEDVVFDLLNRDKSQDIIVSHEPVPENKGGDYSMSMLQDEVESLLANNIEDSVEVEKQNNSEQNEAENVILMQKIPENCTPNQKILGSSLLDQKVHIILSEPYSVEKNYPVENITSQVVTETDNGIEFKAIKCPKFITNVSDSNSLTVKSTENVTFSQNKQSVNNISTIQPATNSVPNVEKIALLLDSAMQNVHSSTKSVANSDNLATNQSKPVTIIQKLKIVKTTEMPLKCLICNKILKTKYTLKKHMNNIHGKNSKKYDVLKCIMCNLRFQSILQFKEHNLIHKHEYPFSCEICGSVHKRNIYLKKHIQRKHKIEIQNPPKPPCNLYYKVEQNPSTLKLLIIKHVNIKDVFKCDHCSKYYRRKFALEDHMINTHFDYYKYHCKICKQRFESIKYLRLHYQVIHNNPNYYICKLCCNSFQSASILKHHYKHKHDKKYKKKIIAPVKEIEFNLACKDCYEIFSTESDLKSHIQHKHTTCPKCPKNFNSTAELDSHIKINHFESKFICGHCDDIKFNEKILLETHVKKNHLKFKCDNCIQTFNSQNSLKIHKIIHTDYRPFACQECGKTYKILLQLIAHVDKVHSERRIDSF